MSKSYESRLDSNREAANAAGATGGALVGGTAGAAAGHLIGPIVGHALGVKLGADVAFDARKPARSATVHAEGDPPRREGHGVGAPHSGGRRARWPGTGGRSAIVGAPRIPLLGLCSHVSIVIKTYTSIETGEQDARQSART